MTLIKSISGIRGTIGGKPTENLTPLDIVKFTSAFAYKVKSKNISQKPKIILGRDARVSGEILAMSVSATLSALGIDVIDIGFATTPTVEMAVLCEKADAGMILTASHNPAQWNALKLLNENGEFLSDKEGKEIVEIAENHFDKIEFAPFDALGQIIRNKEFLSHHIDKILSLSLINVDAIREANLSVVVDTVNSVGSLAVPLLLEKLGVQKIQLCCGEMNGIFEHHPEPLPENLVKLSEMVQTSKANVGFSVDPDVDRLAVVTEKGEMFGEEYTLVAVADYVLKHKKGNTVSNLSSTRALRDISQKYNVEYFAAAVGEVNVVEKMKFCNAIIGGEGNGGVILPELHYGRDALVGIALFLSHLATSKMLCSDLRKQYPDYFISKKKIECSQNLDIEKIFEKIKTKFSDFNISTIDGLKIDFPEGWVHLRRSNTEPIIRLYSEARTESESQMLSQKIIDFFNFSE